MLPTPALNDSGVVALAHLPFLHSGVEAGGSEVHLPYAEGHSQPWLPEVLPQKTKQEDVKDVYSFILPYSFTS